MSLDTKLSTRCKNQKLLDAHFDEYVKAVDSNWMQCGDENLTSSMAFVNFIGRIAYNNNNSLDDSVVRHSQARALLQS